MEENCLLLSYRVNLRVSQTLLNHNQNLFLIICYAPFVCIGEFAKVFDKLICIAARALSSPNRCFQLSTNFDKDFFRCLLCLDAAIISSNAEMLLT